MAEHHPGMGSSDILERDTLGAFCRHTHAALPGAADGPLAGLTFGLKDIYDVAGHRTGFGSPDWLATHGAAERSASVLARLLDAGASLVGRTHTEEMAFSLTGENAHYGTPMNPAAPGRVPGGSSSGSAAAVAGGLVDFAIGSDTGGSVRGPASFCGIWGIRPTHGVIPMDGACPLAPRFDTCGWFARDAKMLARVGSVLLRTTVAEWAPVECIHVATDAFEAMLPGASEAVYAALPTLCAALEAPITEVTMAPEGFASWFGVFRELQYADIWRTHGAWVQRIRPTFGPQVASRFEAVAQVDPQVVRAAEERLPAIRAQLNGILAEGTVIAIPTMPGIAPRRGASSADTVAFREQALGLLCAAGLGGLPQLSIPLASFDGCPIGLSLIAPHGADAWLLSVGQSVFRSVT